MADKKFFVNNGQANVGPYDMVAIIEKINKAELKATDHVCVDVDKDEWILVCQHPEFLQHYEAAKPSKPTIGKQIPDQKEAISTGTANEAGVWIDGQHESGKVTGGKGNVIRIVPEPKHEEKHNGAESAHGPSHENGNGHSHGDGHGLGNGAGAATTATSAIETPIPEGGRTGGGDLTSAEWFVLKGKNRFGPFAYLDVIRMLQEKSVFEYDYVWCGGLDTWKRIAQISCFSADQIQALFEGGDHKVFHRRNHKRAKYETTVIAHDNKSVWKGKTLEVSEGGAGIVITNAMILPGQNVYLHFAPGPLSKPFNVLCEIVSKRYMGGLRDSSSPVIYGVKFVNINKTDREVIRNLYGAA